MPTIEAGTEAAHKRAQAGAAGLAAARANQPLVVIADLQAKLRKLVLADDTEPREAAQAACAWDKLEARRAILLGKPANTSQAIKQVDKTRARKRLSGPVEYLPETEPTKPET